MRLLFLLLTFSLATNCSTPKRMQDAEQLLFEQETKRWQEQRLANLLKPNSWLDVVGLHWLAEGENSFGSSRDNAHRFPKTAPNWIGTYVKSNDDISLKINPEITVRWKDSSITELQIIPAPNDEVVILENETFSWFLIQRNDKYGIRVRNTDSAARKRFDHLDYYPTDIKWKVEADFIPYADKKIAIKNAVGMESDLVTAGQLIFKINGKEQSLDVLDGGENLFFLILADATTGETTYGGGRYLYVKRPDKNGKVMIDFNRAYNPPCVFTDYATCPLPPLQNYLEVAITAGEKSNH
ncbi:MAG: DUF1684 domain-containing protein [Saprospiraceae bacterium]